MVTKSPIEQARALIAELVEFKAKQKTLTGETQSHLFSDLFARLVVSQQELTTYAESLERLAEEYRDNVDAVMTVVQIRLETEIMDNATRMNHQTRVEDMSVKLKQINSILKTGE